MKMLVLAVAACALCGCQSTETTSVNASEIASNGDAIAVIQTESIGFTAIFHLINIVPTDLDTVINKQLVAEAKAMGATKVDLKYASTTPRSGVYSLFGFILGFPHSTAVGVAVR